MKNHSIKFVKYIFYIILLIIMFFLFNNFFESFYKVTSVNLDIQGNDMGQRPIEVFYAFNGTDDYNGENMVGIDSKTNGEFSYNGGIALPCEGVSKFRIDLGNGKDKLITIKDIEYRDYYGKCKFDIRDIAKYSMNDIEVVSVDDNELVVKSVSRDGITEPDPYIEFKDLKVIPYKNHSNVYALISAIIMTIILYRFVRLKAIYTLFADFWSSRKLIFALAKNDFKTKYSGSYFGVIWSFVQPVCTILVFWFVFQVGFRSNDIGNIPYILWFASGLIPWFFFSEAWNSATNSLTEYSFLVKKVVFKVHILPLVKVISNLFVHIFFVVFLVLFFIVYGIEPQVYWLQIIYYSFSMIMLVISLSYITATLVVFFKDLGQIMNIILQFGMWLTPIMWQIDMIPDRFMWLFKLNPMYYVVQGYRDSMIYNVPFYNNIKQTLYFWLVVMVFMLIGSLLYRKLKPHFADVL